MRYDAPMTTEMWIIAAVRIAGSLPVLRWPLAGAIIAMLVDLSDLFMMNLIHLGGVKNYQSFDKWLDQVYMLTFLVVALRWQAAPRNMAIALYTYRMAGFVAFEITQSRDLLLFFPNVFEFWFVFVAALKQFRLEEQRPAARSRVPGLRFLVPFRYSRAQFATVGVVLLAGKLLQEYALHVGRWFDGFTAVEAVEAIWEFLISPLR